MIASLKKMLALTLVAAGFAGAALAQDVAPPIKIEKPEQFNGIVLAQGLEKIFPPRIKPVADAEITLSRFPVLQSSDPAGATIQGVPVWTTRSLKDGTFHFEGLKPGLYRWSASHQEFGAAEGRFKLDGKVGHYERILLTRRPTLNPLGAFAGRVTARPFRPIVYEGVPDGGPKEPAKDEPAKGVSATNEGIVVQKELPVAGAIVEALPAPMPVPVPLPEPLPKPEPLPMPVESAKPDIAIRPPTLPPMPPIRIFRAETDKYGTFVIKGLPLGAYTFRVTHKAHAPARGRFLLTEKEPRVKRSISLHHRVHGVFAGHVVERRPIPVPVLLEGQKDEKKDDQKDEKRPEILPLPKGKPIAGALVSVWRARIRKPLPRPLPPIKPLPPVKAGEPGVTPPASVDPVSADPGAGGAVDEEGDVPGDPGESADGIEPSAGDAGTGGAGANTASATGAAAEDAAADDADDDDDVGAEDGNAGEAPPAAATDATGTGTAKKRILPRRRVRRTKTDEKGNFAMKGLPAGIYRFTVRAKGYTTRRGAFAISHRGPKVFRRIALAKAGGGNQAASFSGVVLSIQYSGAHPGPDIMPPQRVVPVAGALVRIVVIPPPNVRMVLIERKETTNDKGEFTFKDLRPGQYVATVEAKGFFPAKETVDVQGDTARKFYLKPEFLPPAPPKPVEQPSVQGSDTENPFK